MSGAFVQCTFPVKPHQTLNARVGKGGAAGKHGTPSTTPYEYDSGTYYRREGAPGGNGGEAKENGGQGGTSGANVTIPGSASRGGAGLPGGSGAVLITCTG